MIRYKLHTRVRHVTQEMARVYQGGLGEHAVFEDKPTGKWTISLEGVGALVMWEEPKFKPYDAIALILEGPIDAKSD